MADNTSFIDASEQGISTSDNQTLPTSTSFDNDMDMDLDLSNPTVRPSTRRTAPRAQSPRELLLLSHIPTAASFHLPYSI